MAEDMDFESFDNLDDLDWSELEKDLQDNKGAAPKPEAGGAPAAAGSAPAASAGQTEVTLPAGTGIDIGYLLDVNLEVTVEVGKTFSYISNVLSWDRGSIIELEKLVGQPLNVLINSKPVAKGEVVVVNEKFALKITEIMDPKDRLNYLNV